MPGSGKQSVEVQEQIKELLEAGFDPTTIHRKLKVGRSSIYRMKRCLQQHGTNYMPPELNKKNGRPKVLTAEQELEVREWLRDPKNRTRYLDDLVWLIHDRFGIVCSTTTMSKMKRKWLRVIEFEENGTPIDDMTRSQLMETHPDLPALHATVVPQADMSQTDKVDGNVQPDLDAQLNLPEGSFGTDDQHSAYPEVPTSYAEVPDAYPSEPLQPSLSNQLEQLQHQHQTYDDFQASLGAQQISPTYAPSQQQTINSQLAQELGALGNYGHTTS
ncbi:hypothetical protein CKM354_000111700 [Cercospora kikuchii]|uniref:Uncharacterized protein n=1 Tax=Cercospora kikuchii TaxID=84275 RepID=A0A9P3C7M8_9PEZI|nr:uncharacterized protein CKM354_000111700 [Cercospora kikuchii]GIZ37676.1 hypothetical protein CKM354_000111700 [Cercospora kikuchii]